MKKIYILIIIVSLFINCKDEHYAEGKIVTQEVINITGGSATLRGNISVINSSKIGVEIEGRGFVYSENRNQLIAAEGVHNRVYEKINSTGNFSANISELKPLTKYYVQSFFVLLSPKTENILYYVENVFYGNIIEFTTDKAGISPVVTTLSAINTTKTSAILRGNIINVGDPAYTSKGICYSTLPNPTINDSKVLGAGSGIGEFEGTATSLTPGTNYYARAYATNSVETAYGDQITFTTKQQELFLFDDVESHYAFTKNSQGDIGWTYYENGSPTYGFKGIQFPGSGSNFAYIVFKPSATTPDMSTTGDIQPHSGLQFFACFATLLPEDGGTQPNNHWIVSPELSFTSSFKFSFWAKTYMSDYGLERMKVRYSTTTNAQSSFTNYLAGSSASSGYVSVPDVWTKYTYTVPATAKYVAIQCVSDDAFIFMVDDITIGESSKSNEPPNNINPINLNNTKKINELSRKAVKKDCIQD